MERIASFSVDHDKITKGIYISRIDGDITTYDMRTRVPNAGEYMSNITMHSVEHMFATYVRNSEIGKNVIYFGPMGCRTGFYLLVRNTEPADVARVVKKVLAQICDHDGEMFGAARKECGNYLELDLNEAKKEARAYLDVLESADITFEYPQ
ncbi:MAG: S-ribosylhomocysteine lyase [Clostridia bacterium]|nr:S-ribosylhomocysteine lyase [Clostridia bacterium]